MRRDNAFNLFLVFILVITTIVNILTPDVIVVEKTIIETIEIPVPIPEKTIETYYVPTLMQLQNFPSLQALEGFLLNDNTSQIEYGGRFTCMDFALRLIENAAKQNYRVIFFFDRSDEGDGHALCMAYVEEEAKWVIFEPQTDKFKWMWGSTVGGKRANHNPVD